ncbi:MAG: fasciclin domain-containing protein [Methanomicrobiales archaeon]|nr:fasciclin domain-containing protein [Methanomicrobiales archaeon]
MIKKMGLVLGVLVLVLLLSAGCTVEDLTNISTTPTPGATLTPGVTATPGVTQTPGANQTPGAGQSIVEVLQGEGQFSTLLFAVDAANLTDTLTEGGPYTVFAPTDDAFDQVPNETLNDILADEESLNTLLLNHVVEGEYTEDELVGMGNVTTLAGETMNVSRGLLGGMTLNDNVSISDTFSADNGIIYAIDRVLIPEGLPSGNATSAVATTSPTAAPGIAAANTTDNRTGLTPGGVPVVVNVTNTTRNESIARSRSGFF